MVTARDTTNGAGTCFRCKRRFAWIWLVAHRTRKIERRNLCEPCALELVAAYDLVEEAAMMGKSYYVEGWHADTLVEIHDYSKGEG